MIADGRDFGDHVSDYASSPVITAEAGMDVEEAGELMVRHAIRRLVVVDGGRLTGIVTLDDLASRTGDAEIASQLSSSRHPRGDARLLLPRARRRLTASLRGMEGLGGFFNDPDLQRRLQELAEQMQSTQNLAWADNAIKLAVDMTVAAINRVNLQGNAEEQAKQVRAVMATVFPEAVTLVREARQGLSRLSPPPPAPRSRARRAPAR